MPRSIEPQGVQHCPPQARLGIACLVALFLVSAAQAQAPNGELLVVDRATGLVKVLKGEAIPIANLEPGDLLRTYPVTSLTPPGANFARVIVIDLRKQPLEGWVDRKCCHHFHPATLGQHPPLTAHPLPLDDISPKVPALVKRAPERTQLAFKDIEAAIALNKQMKKELPEPYFIRARIWAGLQNYDDALRDYLAAASVIRNGPLDPSSYSTYFNGVKKALDGLRDMPTPPYASSAEGPYYKGRSAYVSRNYRQALRYLDDAVQLNPTEPLHWYYRALTLRELGDTRRAAHDARLGVMMEEINRKKERPSLPYYSQMERVQGEPREWLNSIRRGDVARR